MDFIASWSVATILLLMIAVQTVYILYFCLFLHNGGSIPFPSEATSEPADGSTASISPKFEPLVAVVLCLRGPDPSLVACFEGLCKQEYPNFQIHIAVDSPADPALDVVRNYFQGRTQPTIHTVSSPRKTCSLKCSAILEVVLTLPSSIEVIALIDADAAPDKHWLRDLVRPLASDRIGAVTGNRWFAPEQPGLGSYVRHAWNSAAIVQMQIYNIAWGGTLAIKRSCFETCGLAEKWGQAFCEDTLLTSTLNKAGFQVVRVPDLFLENTEATSMKSAMQWITRQLLTVRLYHPKWNWVLAHGLLTSVPIFFGPILLGAVYFTGSPRAFRFMLSMLLVYQFWNLLLLVCIDFKTRSVIRSRAGSDHRKKRRIHLPLYLAAIYVTQFIHPICCWSANFAKQVRWRGIEYQIGRHAIELKHYVPYCELDEAENGRARIPSVSLSE